MWWVTMTKFASLPAMMMTTMVAMMMHVPLVGNLSDSLSQNENNLIYNPWDWMIKILMNWTTTALGHLYTHHISHQNDYFTNYACLYTLSMNVFMRLLRLRMSLLNCQNQLRENSFYTPIISSGFIKPEIHI